MRKILVEMEIDCGPLRCGACKYLGGNGQTETAVCCLFNAPRPLKKSWINGRTIRCHECRAADKGNAKCEP